MKKPYLKKIMASIAILAIMSSFTACAGGGEDDVAVSTAENPVVVEQAVEETPAPTPEVTEEPVEATPVPTEEPAPEVSEESAVEAADTSAESGKLPVANMSETDEKEENKKVLPPKPQGAKIPNEKTNLLTGEDTLTKEAQGKRSVAVMVNNIKNCLPQYGISAADVVYEVPVEYDITRLMCVYGDYTQVPEMCSIRSCRYYYPILAVGMDSIYIHWGLDMTVAKDTLERLENDHIDGDTGAYGLFGRDQDKLDEGYALEHTSTLDGPALPAAFEEAGFRTDIEENYYKDTLFQFSEEPVVANGEECYEATVAFSSEYYSTFNYNADDRKYYKQHSGNPHMDARSGEQLKFDNVLVLETEVGMLPDDTSGRRKIEVNQKDARGYLLTGGYIQEIKWTKNSDFEKIVITDLKDNPVLLNTGKTYIAICNPDSLYVE
ncbi:MAG: DUF3048 domain-containing protein [Clostridia bacterium]|nr:DUF3048 domain-containing protein [Clostridia bacterium]